jgi:hypothetical protein
MIKPPVGFAVPMHNGMELRVRVPSHPKGDFLKSHVVQRLCAKKQAISHMATRFDETGDISRHFVVRSASEPVVWYVAIRNHLSSDVS